MYLFSNTNFFNDKSSSTDFFSIERKSLPKEFVDINAKQLVTILTNDTSCEDVLSKQDPSYSEVISDLENKEQTLAKLLKQYDLSKEYKDKYTKLQKMFLVQMAMLKSSLSKWGTSINLRWKPEEKREI